MEILVTFFVLFICFFLLYIFSKQDFVLLRQNISLAQVFDSAAIALVPAFLVGRALFILDSLEISFLHVLRFFHLVNFPGFSFFGFILGGSISIYLMYRKRKGISRILDIFTISFFPLFMLSLIMRPYPKGFFFVPIIYIFVLMPIFAFFIKSHYKYILKDGGLALIFLLLVSVDTLIYQFFGSLDKQLFLWLSFSQLICIPLISSSIVFLFLKQNSPKK